MVRMDINPIFSYIPIERGGKRPTEAWKGKSRYPITDVQRWVAEGKNLGIRTDRGSGVFVLDVDLDPKTLRPSRWWEEMIFTHGKPTTMVVRTPSGGWHWYFRQPNDFTVKNSQSAIAPGIDIRGEGGYVLAPGSRIAGEFHGRSYEGFYELEDPEVKPGTAPEWLLELLLARQGREEQKTVRHDPADERPKCGTEGSEADKAARAELNHLMALARQLTNTPDGERIEILGARRGWEAGDGFFVLATSIVNVARWPHTTVTVEQAHKAWCARVPAHYRHHTWQQALDRADSTWEFGDRMLERQAERDEMEDVLGF